MSVHYPPGYNYPQQGRFRMRLIEVDAFRYERGVEFPQWFTDYFTRWPRRIQQVAPDKFDISCESGWRVLEPGMWCVKRPAGGLSVICPDDFAVAYEPLPQDEP